MTAAQVSRWSFPVEDLREIRIELRNAALRIYRTDGSDLEVHVDDGEEIGEMLQGEHSGRALSIVQKGSLRRGPSTPGFGFEESIEATVHEAIDTAFDAVGTLLEGFGDAFPGGGQPGRRHGGHPEIRVRHEGHAHGHHATLHVSVGLPAALEMPALSARLDRGPIEVADTRGDLTLHTGMGTISLTRCGRACTANTGRGDVTARDCSGDLDLHTGMGDIGLTGCEGSARVRSGKGAVHLEGCRLEGSAHTGYGDLWLDRVTGQGTYQTGAGNITVSRPEAADLQLHTGRGEIVVQDGTADRLRAHSGAGTIRLVDLRRAGRVEAHTGMGTITAHGGTVDWLRMKGGAGNLECALVLGPGDHELETGAGNIEVRLPPDARVRVDAVTRMGSVHSDFGLVKVGRPGPATLGGGRFVGSIGDGEATATLHMKTGAGNIAIRRASGQWTRVEDEAQGAAGDGPQGAEPGHTPSGDRTRLEVLHSLQRGEISVEEAMALLERLTP